MHFSDAALRPNIVGSPDRISSRRVMTCGNLDSLEGASIWFPGGHPVVILDQNIWRTYNTLALSKNCTAGTSPMPETVADLLLRSCSLLLSKGGILESQSVGPDPFVPRARDARGRFAKGSSGNPRGRPRGIRNPRRRIPNLVARPLSAPALSKLLDRKPHLLRPLAVQLLPPPLAPIDPAKRLGIDLVSLRTIEDFRQLLPRF
jgi:hypothetical protein